MLLTISLIILIYVWYAKKYPLDPKKSKDLISLKNKLDEISKPNPWHDTAFKMSLKKPPFE